MTRGTFYPMTLKGNVNPWIDMNVIVETILNFVDMRINQKGWRSMWRRSRILFYPKTLFMTFKKLFQLRKQVSSNICT